MSKNRKRLPVIVGLVLVGMVLLSTTIFYAWQRSNYRPALETADSGYVNSTICGACHQEILRSYRLTGMGRSLYRPSPENLVEDYKIHNQFYSQTSDRYYTMLERNGKLYQRRHQIGFDGKETNIAEKDIDFVVGSGNHARSYLHRNPDGTLIQLPVSWYTEQGGYWAMSPGYDRPTQPDFRRTLTDECLFCHSSYPNQSANATGGEPVLDNRIPEGIDCQRCHGPGRAHVRAAGSGKSTPEAIRRAILNPARLNRDRQLETCMQCHLETTSRELPHAIRRYDRGPFSYRPGEPLGDYFVAFDQAPVSGRDDRFEIAHAAYRLRKSACFQASQMTCTTCHDPHQQTSGQEAVRQYVAACRTCHAAAHASNMPVGANCVNCHMPKRRTEDAVHVVMTDHYIQRRPGRDSLAPLREQNFAKYDTYRGEVVLYYPPQLPETPDNQLYLDVAQVRDGADLAAGIPRLQRDLEKYKPGRAEFYFELAEAYSKSGDQAGAIHWYDEALNRRPDFRPALEQLGVALIASGNLPRAAETLEKAVAGPAPGAAALTNLGVAYLKQGKLEPAEHVLHRALGVNPDAPEALNLIGLLSAQNGNRAAAEASYRQAISIQPDFAEAHYNLANLLAAMGRYPEAQFHFEKAISSQPAYMEAHHNYGNLLVLMGSYEKASIQFQDTLRLAPDFAQAHGDLAHALAAQGRLDGAADEYERAIRLDPNFYEAHLSLGALFARRGDLVNARAHFAKASESPDPEIRQIAQKALR